MTTVLPLRMLTTNGTVDPVVVLGLLAPVLYAYRYKLGTAAGQLGEWLLCVVLCCFLMWSVGTACSVCYQVTSASGTHPLFGMLCTAMLVSRLSSN